MEGIPEEMIPFEPVILISYTNGYDSHFGFSLNEKDPVGEFPKNCFQDGKKPHKCFQGWILLSPKAYSPKAEIKEKTSNNV